MTTPTRRHELSVTVAADSTEEIRRAVGSVLAWLMCVERTSSTKRIRRLGCEIEASHTFNAEAMEREGVGR